MADHGAVRCSGEPAIGDQCHCVSQALPDERAGDRQHFAHTGAALGPFVPDHNDVAGFDFPALYRLEGCLFLIEDPRRTFVHLFLVAGDLDYRAVGGKVAAQDSQAARGATGRVEVIDNGLVVHSGGFLEVFRQGLAVHRHGVPVQQAGVQQTLADERYSTVAAQVGHDVAAARLHVGDVGGVAADAIEVLQRQVNVRFPSNGHQVQHGVGGASHGRHQRYGVLKGLPGQNVPRPDALVQHPHHRLAGAAGLFALAGVHRRQRRVAGQGQPHDFNGRGHRVGGEQSAAGTLPRARSAFQLRQFLAGDVAGRPGAHRFKHVLDVYVVAVVLARQNAAAVHEDTGDIQAGNGHHAARHILVAAAHGNQAVHSLAEDHGFDGISDDLAAHQRRLHAFGAHADAVADGDGAELERRPTAIADPFLDCRGPFVQMDIARRNVTGQIGHRHKGLCQVVVRQAHSPQVRAGRRPLRPVGDVAAAVLQ